MKKIDKRDQKGRIEKGNGATHGKSESAVYDCWVAMKQRCLNEKHPCFRHYGGRGIGITERWMTFENFYEDMGEPRGRTLDRIDVNQGYSKENCRWITIQEQQKNRRDSNPVPGASYEADRKCWNVRITFKGKRTNLGRFKSLEAAKEARAKAEMELWRTDAT